MALYSKPFLELPDQVALLQSRGLEITDGLAAQDCLRRIGYYRLSGYLYPFRVPLPTTPPSRDNTFLPGSRFEDALALYVFDKNLKMLVMDAIERVEIAVRVGISTCLGRRGAFAYLDPTELHPDFSEWPKSGVPPYVDWNAKMNQMIGRSKEEFVSHFKSNYQLPMPIWMASELWDFGMMVRLYSGLRLADRQSIATNVGVANGVLFESWLRALNVIRNIVAHHARLWNRFLGVSPQLPRRGLMPSFDVLPPQTNKRVYSILCILAYTLEIINPSSDWKTRVVTLANSFPSMPHAKLSDIGFPPNWQTQLFWN